MAFWDKLRSKVSRAPDCIDDILDEAGKDVLRRGIRHDVWRRDLERHEIAEAFATYRPLRRKRYTGHPILVSFAMELLAQELEAWKADSETWPSETDCDRLAQVFAALNSEGVVALENCGGTLGDATTAAAEEFEHRLECGQLPPDTTIARYLCYHEQDIENAIDGEGLFLAFGAINWQDGDEEEAESRELAATCKTRLERAGLKVWWDGTTEQRLHLKDFRWQRRELLPVA